MLAPCKAAVLGLKFQHGRGCSQSSLQKLGMISNHRHLHLTRAPIHQQTHRIDATLTYRVLVPNLQSGKSSYTIAVHGFSSLIIANNSRQIKSWRSQAPSPPPPPNWIYFQVALKIINCRERGAGL
ncbi:hypothetical protein Anapl_07615 [Anas platyrhynchos]|uniref:Uncharacterized protein n=1 Tax=Anas platyrhynchos TaxID=8839 RepID=R0JGP3_ANAPL|nr:hypothetical protein Anapl_07615 [Anas platyrhynchos]